jgi:hypothetical protein
MDFHDRNQLFPLTMEIETSDSPLNEDPVLESLGARRCTAHAFGVPFKDFHPGAILGLKVAESSRRCAARLRERLLSSAVPLPGA